MKRIFSILIALALVLGFSLVAVPATPVAAAGPFTFAGGSLTTTNTNSWGGYNSYNYPVHFNVDAGPLTIEYLGVNMYPIDYTGDMGWPPDSTDTGAFVITGVGNGYDIFQYSNKSNMGGSWPRGTDPETYGKGSWNAQTTGHWNEDGYRSYLFQGQYTGHWVDTVGNSQYNAEKHGGPTGNDPDYDTFDFKIYVEKTGANTYDVTGWHVLWKSSAIDEGCPWDWNYAKNAHDLAKRGYLKCYEGTWTATGLDLSDVQVFLAIQNWAGTQPHLYTFDWDGVVITGTVVPPDEVWVDDNYYDGGANDGHVWGYDAFNKIQDGIDAVAGSTVHVAAGTYQESKGGWRDIEIFKSLNIIGAGSGSTVVELSGLQHGVEIRPDATGVVLIEGMTFTKRAANSMSAGFAIRVGETGGTFNSLTFRDVEVAWAQGRNLYLDSGGGGTTYQNILLENCNIHDAGAWGFSGRGTVNSMVVKNSHFDHNGWFDASHGIGFDIDMPLSVASLNVEGGTFNYNTAKGINLVKTNNAIFTDITTTNNGGAPGGGFGVCLWEWSGTSQNLIFDSPVLKDNATDGFLIGCETGMTVQDVTITCATMTGNGRAGLFVYRASGWGEGMIDDVVITCSTITGNSQWGVAAIMAYEDIDARYNWWGDASGPGPVGPGSGDQVSDNVNYKPWLFGPPPVYAVDDFATTDEDTPVTIDVLGNDTNCAGNPLTVIIVSHPGNGTATENIDQTVTYSPKADWFGTDTFTYKFYDGHSYSNEATVIVTVTPVNDDPIAYDDSYYTCMNKKLTVAAPGVLTNDDDVDGDPLTAILVKGPKHGKLALNSAGSFTYTPNTCYSGIDSFIYKANDGTADSNDATVVIGVNVSTTVVKAPTYLIAVPIWRTVMLAWTDNSNNEEGFYIERATKTDSGYTAFVRVGQVSANAPVYTENVPPGTYKYRVQAFNLTIDKVSAYSNEASVRVR